MKLMDWIREFFGNESTTYNLYNAKYLETAGRLSIESFAVAMATNLIAGAIAKCEIKTYNKGKESRGDEYYLWNVEPNINQNSTQFIAKIISRMLMTNKCLVVESGGQLLIAESFNVDQFAVLPNVFRDVEIKSTPKNFKFERTFSMSEVLYFELNNQNIAELLGVMLSGYEQLADMGVKKYKRSGGRKGKVNLDKTKSGDEAQEKKIEDLFKKQFQSYFDNENAIITLPRGVEYEEISGDGSRKSTSEITDIVSITEEAFARVAQAFNIPPALLKGDISDINALVNHWLTVCIDPIVDVLQTEINRKRYGKNEYLAGNFIRIDTTNIKHTDLFAVAVNADKLLASGITSIDELRRALGLQPLNTAWSKRHFITKNYSDIETQGGGVNSG